MNHHNDVIRNMGYIIKKKLSIKMFENILINKLIVVHLT